MREKKIKYLLDSFGSSMFGPLFAHLEDMILEFVALSGSDRNRKPNELTRLLKSYFMVATMLT